MFLTYSTQGNYHRWRSLLDLLGANLSIRIFVIMEALREDPISTLNTFGPRSTFRRPSLASHAKCPQPNELGEKT